MNKRKLKIGYILSVLMIFFMRSTVAFASSIESSKLVTGTKSILDDFTKALLVLDPILTVAFAGITLVQLQTSDEQSNDAPLLKKRLKRVLILAVVIECLAGLVTLILKYYE